MRKPSRMPFFTQAFTRQPLFDARIGLGSSNLAAVQRFFEAREGVEVRFGDGRWFYRRRGARCQPRASTVSSEIHAPQHRLDLRQRLRLRRHQRQALDRLDQAHGGKALL